MATLKLDAAAALPVLSSREDVARFLLAMDAAELLARGAHETQADPLAEQTNGRQVLASIARRELRERAQLDGRLRVASVAR